MRYDLAEVAVLLVLLLVVLRVCGGCASVPSPCVTGVELQLYGEGGKTAGNRWTRGTTKTAGGAATVYIDTTGACRSLPHLRDERKQLDRAQRKAGKHQKAVQ